MQLDKTRIVIRERVNSELLDLALHVLRAHFAPLSLLLLLGVAPFALVNFWIVGRYALPKGMDFAAQEYVEFNSRYFRYMVELVFLQSPLATSLITIYMGMAVFIDRPRLANVFADLRRLGWRQLWCQGVLRLALPVTLVVAMLGNAESETQLLLEFAVLGLAVLSMSIVRSVRPYLSEIVLLEKNPLVTGRKGTMTVGKRSKMLHDNYGGDLFSRWLGTVIAAALLAGALFQSVLFLQGVFLNNWAYHTWFMLHIGFPLTLWLVAGFIAIYRFLSYLNLRIHSEGWEVDLLLRAEATRLQDSLADRFAEPIRIHFPDEPAVAAKDHEP